MALKWKLANDANDKISKGEVLINANTVFNGDATIVSQGTNETTEIKGGSITFTRDGYPITVIRNVQVGEIETNSEGKGILSFPRFKNMNLVLSIKSFNISQNIRSLGCYANLLNLAENKYQFFLYGKESGLAESTEWKSTTGIYNTQYTKDCLGITLSSIHLYAPVTEVDIKRDGHNPFPSFDNVQTVPTVDIKVYITSGKETKLVKHISDYKFKVKIIRQYESSVCECGADSLCSNYKNTVFGIYLDDYVNINVQNTLFNIESQTIRVETKINDRWILSGGWNIYGQIRVQYKGDISVYANGTYSLEKLENLVGNGTLFYMAVEV